MEKTISLLFVWSVAATSIFNPIFIISSNNSSLNYDSLNYETEDFARIRLICRNDFYF